MVYSRGGFLMTSARWTIADARVVVKLDQLTSRNDERYSQLALPSKHLGDVGVLSGHSSPWVETRVHMHAGREVSRS